MWSNKFWRFCLNFWILPRFFGVWAWKLTDLCHSSAPCFWIGQRVPLLLIVLKIYDRPWRCEMDSWLGVSKYPFFGLFLRDLDLCCEKLSVFVTTVICLIDMVFFWWVDTYLTSFCCPCELFSQRFSLPSLSSIVFCRSRRCRPLWTNYSVSFDSIFGTLLHN